MGIYADRARELRPNVVMAAQSLPDEEAAKSPELFARWETDTEYEVGDRRTYDGILYSCIQAHMAQDDWTPDVAVSLWAKVLIPDPKVIPEWEQPGSTNPYMKGDKVRHIEKIWVSLIDNNVWEPGATGSESLWAEVEE